MRVFGRAGGDKPWSAGQIRILSVVLHCAVLRVLPKSLDPIDRHLLNGTVISVGRARSAVSDDRVGMRCVRSIREEIPLEIISPIVSRECGLWSRDPLQP